MSQFTITRILEWAKKQKAPFGSAEMVEVFKISRQTAARHLKKLVEAGLLIKSGATHNAQYAVPAKAATAITPPSLKLNKKLKGLQEDRVFDEIDLKLGLKSKLNENTYRIANYAFSEMLNNAIDHSESKAATINVGIKKGKFEFSIRDLGIGVYRNIRKGFKLKTDEEAVEHLLKGKQTTAPRAHSGQGIFFTSKIADHFLLKSDRLMLTFENENDDLRLSNERAIKGTLVEFSIKLQTRKSLNSLFAEYANEDFEFDRTKYPVVILQQNGAISRSQARRLTMGLEKFDRIILDFHKVKEIGQGFADEIFRVFQSKHPKIVIESREASTTVNFMIRRAIANTHK